MKIGFEFREQENVTQHLEAVGVVFAYSKEEDEESPKIAWL